MLYVQMILAIIPSFFLDQDDFLMHSFKRQSAIG